MTKEEILSKLGEELDRLYNKYLDKAYLNIDKDNGYIAGACDALEDVKQFITNKI